MKTALITGLTGRDGSYLAELLLYNCVLDGEAYATTTTDEHQFISFKFLVGNGK